MTVAQVVVPIRGWYGFDPDQAPKIPTPPFPEVDFFLENAGHAKCCR
jgi:hypothetical protein